jgi:hypothetical protein
VADLPTASPAQVTVAVLVILVPAAVSASAEVGAMINAVSTAARASLTARLNVSCIVFMIFSFVCGWLSVLVMCCHYPDFL